MSDPMRRRPEPRTLVPICALYGLVGHLLKTNHGWRACDAQDHLVGYFHTEASAAHAVLAQSAPFIGSG